VHEPRPAGSKTVDESEEDIKIYDFGDDYDLEKQRKRRKQRNELIGTPSDVALLRYVEHVASVEGVRQRFQAIFEIPFNSVRRWQLVVAKCLCAPQTLAAAALATAAKKPNEAEANAANKDNANKEVPQAEFIVMMKGAPEVILSRCSKVSMSDELCDLTDEFRHDCQVRVSAIIRNSKDIKFNDLIIQAAWEHFGNEGRRVIAFAQKHFQVVNHFNFPTINDKTSLKAPSNAKFHVSSSSSADQNITAYPENDLVFLGLAAIMDPPRNETAAAIQQVGCVILYF
jgi:sodium/potassium-transporting ATPase subunit alpha